MKKFLMAFISLVISFAISAQEKPVQFSITQSRINDSIVAIHIVAKPSAGIKLFSIFPVNKDLPVNSSIEFDSSISKFKIGIIEESGKAITAKDSGLNTDVKYFTDSVTWTQNFLAKDSIKIKVKALPFINKNGSLESGNEENLRATILPIIQTNTSNTNLSKPKPSNPFSQLLIGLLIGLAAVFTPCVFPLLPMTASFFTKRSKTKAQGIRNAWIYAFFIIFIYVVPALLLVAFSKDGRVVYQISTSTFANLAFFVVFLIFAISFFGAFEITLPASWTNAADSKASGGGVIGIFFMALTMVIVSFSCTGPFVSGMLVATAQSGIGLAPILGMLGFGIGFAVPFAIMATFPRLLQSLPKSGGWLNSIKIIFGFIELALALKFLSSADQALHWGLLNRDVFIALWIVLAFLMGVYLLGKLKFSHDSDLPYITIPRLFFAIASFGFGLYLLPGMWGAPLESLSGILPNPSTQQFNLYESLEEIKAKNLGASNTANETTKAIKYTNLFKAPYGLPAFFDYKEGMAAAKAMHKPVMIDFTGHSCANCRKMEAGVWIDSKVQEMLRNDFVLIQLYVDDKTDLPDNEVYKDAKGEEINNIGNKNLDLEYNRFGNVSQPFYVYLDNQEKLLFPNGVGYGDVGTVEKFLSHLQTVKDEFKKRNP